MEANGNKREVGEDGGIVIIYKKDGTFTEDSKLFKSGGGNWSYKHAIHSIETVEGRIKTLIKVLSLTKDQMTLEVKYPDRALIVTYKSEE